MKAIKVLADFPSLEVQCSGKARSLLPYFADDTVTDILLQSTDAAFLERNGKLEAIPLPFSDRQSLDLFVERLVVPTGRRLDARNPFIDGTMVDGSRFHIIMPPVSAVGPCISIRKLRQKQGVTLSAFAEETVIERLVFELGNQKNILISGSTGSGKTTLLGLLMSAQAADIRWIVVEECREIVTASPHVVRLEARAANAEGVGEITLRQLVRNTLRMRPDRIVVGECRGGEAFDMLQAMATGHGGSLGTLHASSARDALCRLECLATLSGGSLPLAAIRSWVSHAVHFVVHVSRVGPGRRITEIVQVQGMEGDKYRILPIFSLETGAQVRWGRSTIVS